MGRRVVGIALAACMALLVAVGLAQVVGCAQSQRLTVGFIYDNSEDTPYSKNFHLAQEAVEREFGGQVKVIAYPNALEDGLAPLVDEMAGYGTTLIFTNNYGNLRALAPSYPDIEFCQVSNDPYPDDEAAPNYHTFKGEVYQARYASGVVAGLKLQELIERGVLAREEAKVGFVAAFPYAEVISGYTAFFLGVRSVVETATMEVCYTYAWDNYVLERDCATRLLEDGCRVISQHTDTVGPAVACEEFYGFDAYHVGYNQSMADVAPNTSLVSSRICWEPYVLGAVRARLEGKAIEDVVKGSVHPKQDMSAGFEQGWVELVGYNEPLLPEGAHERVDAAIEGLKSGERMVFAGDYVGVNPDDPSDVCDLSQGFPENADSSIPSFHYLLKDVVEVVEVEAAQRLTEQSGEAPSATGVPAAGEATPRERPSLRVASQDPGSFDPQLAPEGDLAALNVFDRLVETRPAAGTTALEPALAASWEVADDGMSYRFQLREGVLFSNGAALTASDVRYTLERLVKNSASPHAYLAMGIVGARALAQGEADTLKGFRELDELSFEIELEEPRPAFLASLSSTGASILDEETTDAAGEDFGVEATCTVGTGPYALGAIEADRTYTLVPHERCWSSAPGLRLVEVSPVTRALPYRTMYGEGELDLLDIAGMDMEAEYFARGDSYRKDLLHGLRAELSCLVLGDDGVLADARVREALASALDKEQLLKLAAGGRGVTLGSLLVPQLTGGAQARDVAGRDLERARALLAEAGLAEGFDLSVSYPATATGDEHALLGAVALMWEELGVRTTLAELPADDYAEARAAGRLSVHVTSLLAAYDDPSSIFDPLFSEDAPAATSERAAMPATLALQVTAARATVDDQARAEAYRALDEELVRTQFLVVPLFSRSQVFVVAPGLEGIELCWNAASGIDLRGVSVAADEG